MLILEICTFISYGTSTYGQSTVEIRLRSDAPGAQFGLGTIYFDNVPYSLPITIRVSPGIYDIEASPPSGYRFDGWDTIGSVEVTSRTSIRTFARVFEGTSGILEMNLRPTDGSGGGGSSGATTSGSSGQLIERTLDLQSIPDSDTTSFDVARSIDYTNDGRKDAYVYIDLGSGGNRLSITMSVEGDDDIDMRLYRPDGNEASSSTSGTGSSESIAIDNPVSGRWRLHVYGYSISGSTANVSVSAGVSGSVTAPTTSGGSASSGQLTPNSSVSGSGTTIYSYQISVSSRVSLTLTMSSNPDFDMHTKWDGSRPSTSFYDCRPYNGAGSTETCERDLTAGTYYVLVNLYSGSGSYTLTLNTISSGGGVSGGVSSDDNDSPSNAVLLQIGGSYRGEISPAGDIDYYKFAAQAGNRYAIETLNLGSGMDTYIHLYSTNGVSEMAFDDDSGEGYASKLELTAPAAGTYYVKVRHYSSGTGSYDIRISLSLSSSILKTTPYSEDWTNGNKVEIGVSTADWWASADGQSGGGRAGALAEAGIAGAANAQAMYAMADYFTPSTSGEYRVTFVWRYEGLARVFDVPIPAGAFWGIFADLTTTVGPVGGSVVSNGQTIFRQEGGIIGLPQEIPISGTTNVSSRIYLESGSQYRFTIIFEDRVAISAVGIPGPSGPGAVVGVSIDLEGWLESVRIEPI